MTPKKIQIHKRRATQEVCRDCRTGSKFYRVFFLAVFTLIITVNVGKAQELFFRNGEELRFEIRYKYGLIVMKAGTINYRLNTVNYKQKQAVCSSLDLKTSAFFDKIYKIRDTLTSYAELPDLEPIYHTRSVNEGGAHFGEELFVLKHSPSFTEINVKQKKGEELKYDTVISINNLGYDFLNVFLFLRNLDYAHLNTHKTHNVTTFLGRHKANIVIRYLGQTVIEKNDSLKYNALLLAADIANDAFSESTAAMEVWVSNDPNHIPLKIKAKLKIGAVEALLLSYKNLKYPLDSEVRLIRKENNENYTSK